MALFEDLPLFSFRLALFVWLISHGRKYCSLIYCERKTLLND